MKKKVFYIAQYFTPEPYLKDIQFVKDLQNKGFDVTVITGYPNYPQGKIYSGFKNSLFSEELMDGVPVIRTFTYADHSTSAIKRALNYLVFGLFAALAIVKYGKKNSFYYILQSSPFVLLCAWAVRLFKPKSKLLLDIQDVFPENIRVSGFIKSEGIISFIDWILNTFYYSCFDLFVTVSQSFRKIVISKGIAEKNVHTIYNWSMVESDSSQVEKYSFDADRINIIYAGNIGVHQGLSKLAEGFKIIEKEIPQVHFHFFGDGTDFVALESASISLENVTLHGRVSSKEIVKYLYAADILFLHLIKDPIYECIIPSKLQAYVEVGKPILGGIEGEARALVTDNQLGEVFEPENNIDFAASVKNVCENYRKEFQAIRDRSEKLYKNDFSRMAGINKIVRILEND